MELTLTIYDVATGEEERVSVDSRRFTIGRLPENDLMIDDTNLSRRHAIIETVDESLTVSDCGSQNGTFVNGRPVVGAVRLRDGDVLTFGGTKEITVEMPDGSISKTSYTRGAPAPVTQTPPKNSMQVAGKPAPVLVAPSWLNAPVVAAAAAVLILLGAGLLLALNRGSAPSRKSSEPIVVSQNSPVPANPDDIVKSDDNAADSTVKPQDDVVADSVTKPNDDSDELRIIYKHARAVMSSISDDRSPVLPSEVISQINVKVKQYAAGSSTLREELRTINQRGLGQLTPAAKANDLKLPLLVFAALAKIHQDGLRRDPIAVAQDLLPALRRLKIVFGTELANDSLLVVATLDQPPNGNFHPLQLAINKLAKDPRESVASIRTVWYLHEHQKLSSDAYDRVLEFLAIGVVAQDPRHFGVDAEPLTF